MRIAPRRTEKPDERAKTLREAEQASVSANTNNKRNRQLPRDRHTFRNKLPLGKHWQTRSQVKANQMAITRGTCISQGNLYVSQKRNVMAITRGTRTACQGRGMRCSRPRPCRAKLLDKAVAGHAAGQGIGIASCWQWHAWHAAGQGCGMARCQLGKGYRMTKASGLGLGGASMALA